MKVILVVEDEQEVRKTIVEVLENNGYDVFQSGDGQEAISYLRTYTPDLVISDIMMPNVDGYEVLKYIKNNPATESVPLIFLTAKAEFQEIQKGLEYGADQYLLKPFRMKDLITAVEIQLTNKNKVGDKFISLN